VHCCSVDAVSLCWDAVDDVVDVMSPYSSTSEGVCPS
jgi:hypothetical protein